MLIRTFAQQWSTRPTGCSIDVVNLANPAKPDWRIVECNDGYSLGSYGLHPHAYAELLVRRWTQLTQSSQLWD